MYHTIIKQRTDLKRENFSKKHKAHQSKYFHTMKKNELTLLQQFILHKGPWVDVHLEELATRPKLSHNSLSFLLGERRA